MKRYIKEGIIKTRKQIVIHKDGMSTYNPTKEMILADGWMEYRDSVDSVPSEKVLLERAIRKKLEELHAYDEGEEVNDCIIVYQGQELHYWADKSERDTLKGAVRDFVSIGRDSYRLDLRDKGVSLVLNCEMLLQMLAALEVYAIDCYNKTTDHEFAIKALTTNDDVDTYEFRGVGYPQIPRFEL